MARKNEIKKQVREGEDGEKIAKVRKKNGKN